jgi:hypothetical protein
MFLFIASEAMLFGAFFTAYFFVRVVNPDAPATWPPEPYTFPVFVASVNTAILVTSSFTIHWATQSIKRGDRNGLKAGLVMTILLGSAFLLTQAIEYAHVGFNTSDRAPRRPCLHRALAPDDRGGACLPRPLLARPLPRRRDPRDLLALRRRDVDHRLGGRLPAVGAGHARLWRSGVESGR